MLTISDINCIKHLRNEKGLKDLEDAMNNQWLATYLFLEKQAIEEGYYPVDFEWVHKDL